MSFDANADGVSEPPVVSTVAASRETVDGAGTAQAAIFTIDAPQWLHPSSIVFDVLSQVRRHIVPAVFAALGAASGRMFWVATGALIFAFALLFTAIRYLTLRYRITDGDLIVSEGLVFRRVRTVPVRRIQNIDLNQNILHRWLKVAEVRIETASGSEPESVLRVLSLDQVVRLRQAIFRNQTVAEMGDASTSRLAPGDESDVGPLTATRASQAASSTPVLQIGLRWLILAGLCSNRGMVIAAVVFGWLVQGERAYTGETLRRIWGYVPQGYNWIANVTAVLLFLIAATLALRLLSCVWYVLRFYGYRLERHGDDLRISCGLFTKVSATVPRKRIQLISVHRPLLFRGLGLASIRVETAGGSGGGDDAVTSVGRQWFVPVVDDREIPRLLSEIRPGWSWDPAGQSWQSTAPRTGARLGRMAVVVSLIVSAIGVAVMPPWGLAFGAALLPLQLWFAWKQSRAVRYAPADFGIAFRSGIFTRKLSFTFYERLQTLRLDQSPFDRRWQMATLSLDTAGAGPADHRIEIPYLDEAFARSEFERLRVAAARHIPQWA